MNKILETQRLILREFELSDAEAIFRLNEDINVIRYTGDPPFTSIAAAENFLRNYSDYDRNGYGRWAVIRKEDNAFVGRCGLKLNEQNHVDIGFRYFKKEWGKGYATEAALATLEFGFRALGIQEIIGRAARENVASLKVLQKLGMTFWKDDACQGIVDSVYYRINRNQYAQLHDNA